MASGAFSASAACFRLASIALPRRRSAFFWMAPVFNLRRTFFSHRV
ncbi:DUF1010 domain-containing protein [Delftia sp. DLF01]